MMPVFGLLGFFFPLVMAAGVGGLPLGMPPLPEDPLISRVAPDECLWYLSSSGIAAPQADSKNATERLMAEPEIAQLYDKVEKEVLAMLRREEGAREDHVKNSHDVAKLIRTMGTRPFAMFVTEVKLAGEMGSPEGKGGLIVNLGEEAADIEKTLLEVEDSIKRELDGNDEIKFELVDEAGVSWHQITFPSPAPPVAWGVRGRYLLIGVGKNAGPEMIARASSEPPKWLTDAKERLPVERISMVSYINLAGARELAGPLMMAPQVSDIVQSFSADKLDAVISVSGLDATDCVTRTLLKTASGSSEQSGFLSLVEGAPITAAEIEHIPADATIAAALRLDGTKVLSWVLNTLNQVEPRATEDFGQVEQIVSQVAGADLRSEILPALGDVWSLYASPADGGFPWTGAVLSVSVKDHETLSKVQKNLVQFIHGNLPPPENPRRNHASLRTVKVGSETIYFMNIVERENPIAPAWCLTEDRLTIAFYPQAIKGMLSIDSAEKRLSEVPEVASQLSSSAPLLGLTYFDTRTLFRTFYPAAQIGMQMAASEWQREGFNLDISFLPPARTIERHLQPSTMAFARATDGLEFTSHQSVPGGSVAGVVPVLLGAGFPAVTSARSAARTNQDINKLKNIMLAMHNHHDVHRRLPAAEKKLEKGKGLSWRVALLPFLEEPALYDEFHHDEPWDSKHNLTLIRKMPQIYRSSSTPASRAVIIDAAKEEAIVKEADKVDESAYDAYKTRFLTLRHEDSIFPPGLEKGLGFRSVTDGTSKTIGVVQAKPEAAVIWTKPDDLDFDPEEPLAGLGDPNGFFLAAFVDGHVTRISAKIADEMMKALMTRAGGEGVRLDD